MIFTVVWMPDPEEQLATLWLNAVDRDSVTRSTHRIDEMLRIDPHERGDLLFDTVRTLIVGALGVDFEVTEDDRLVRILAVWDASIERLDSET